MTSKVDICYRGLNVITYLKDCYCLYHNDKLSTRQKLCGIAPRVLGLVADGGTAFSSNKDLKIISNLISGILPLPDALVNETSCEGRLLQWRLMRFV